MLDKNCLTPSLLNNLPGMLHKCQNDGNWTMISVSAGCLALTGYSREELVVDRTVDYFLLIHPEDRTYVKDFVGKNLVPGSNLKLEYRIITRSGIIKSVVEYFNGVYNQQGGLEYIEGFVQDVSGQKEKLTLLNEYHSLQAAINKGSSVSITNKDGIMVYVNDLFCEYSGYSSDELIGMPHSMLNSGFHPPEFFKNLWDTINAGNIWRGEIRNKAKNGSFYWVDTVISTIYNEQNEIEFFISIRNNITQKKKTQFLQDLVFDIAKTSGVINDLPGLAKYIHSRISKVVNATNLFIAIYDKEKHSIAFPYFYDEYSKTKIKNYTERPFTTGLTEYIIKNRQPLFFKTKAELSSFIDLNRISTFMGEIAKSWLGVPLLAEEEVIGVLAIQSYNTENAYTEEDFKFLQFVSGQVALSIKRQKEQDDLKKSQEKYREIVQLSSDIILTLDEFGQLVFVNNSWERILGYETGRVIGKDFQQFVHPDYREKAEQILMQLQSGKKNKIAIVELANTKGDKIICRASFVSSYRDEKLVATQVFMHDITRKLAAEEKTKRSYKELTYLYHINQGVLQGAGLEEIAEKSIVIFNDLLKKQDTRFFFFNPNLNRLESFSTGEGFDERIDIMENGVDGCPIHEVIRNRKAIVTDDPKEISQIVKSRGIGKAQEAGTENIKTYGLIPLFEGREIFGMISFTADFQFLQETKKFVLNLAQTISVAIAKAKAKEQLAEQKKFTEMVLNNLPADLAVFDPQQKYIFVNHNGTGNEEIRQWLIGKDDFDYCRKRNLDLRIAERRKKEFENAIAFKKSIEWVEEWQGQNLEKKYILRRLVPYLENGGLKYVIGYGTDVTQLKNAEISLLKSERLLSKAEKLAHVGSCEIDLVNERGFWSDGFFRICGYFSQFFIFTIKKGLSVIFPDDVENVVVKVKEAVKNHQSFKFEFRIIRPNKEVRNLSMAGEAYYENEKPVKIVAAFADITEQKKYESELLDREQKLKESNKLNKQLIDSSEYLFYIVQVEPENRMQRAFVYLSPQVEELYGAKPSEILGNPRFWNESIHPDDIENLDSDICRLQESKKPVTSVYRIKNHQKGQYIWVEDYLCPIVGENGEILELYGSAKNITALKEKEIERENLLLELSDKYNELMQFNYIVSHNLRAPVASLMGLSSVLNLPEIDEEERSAIFKHVHESASRMDTLIKDLSVILASKSPLNEKKEEVSLREVFKMVYDNLERQVFETNAQVKLEVGEGADKLFTIKSYLQSVFHNLISNAIKYRSQERNPVIHVSTEKSGANILMKFSDNGLGIDLEKHGEYIFGLYKRFHYEIEGKGLGLHMTRNQVKALGGNIELESEPDKGTIFSITIPQ